MGSETWNERASRLDASWGSDSTIEQLREVFEVHGPPVRRRLKLRFGRLTDADREAALNTALLKLWSARHQDYEGTKAPLGAWLQFLAHRAAFETVERRTSNTVSLESQEPIWLDRKDADEPKTAVQEALDEVLAELPPRDFEILMAQVDAGPGGEWTHLLEATLRMSPNALRLRASRVRKIVEAKLAERGFPSRRRLAEKQKESEP